MLLWFQEVTLLVTLKHRNFILKFGNWMLLETFSIILIIICFEENNSVTNLFQGFLHICNHVVEIILRYYWHFLKESTIIKAALGSDLHPLQVCSTWCLSQQSRHFGSTAVLFLWTQSVSWRLPVQGQQFRQSYRNNSNPCTTSWQSKPSSGIDIYLGLSQS